VKTSHAVTLAVGMVLAALIFGLFFYGARHAENTVSVRGAATERFQSDMVKWRVTLSQVAGLNDMKSGYRRLSRDITLLKSLLASAGIDSANVSIQPISSYSNYDRDGQITGNTLQQAVFVITSDIDAIDDLALNPEELIEKGVVLQSSRLEYFYSGLAEIKTELLAAATEDARRRAEKIVENSGVAIGKVTALRAGVFQIREPFSTEISDYGMHNTQTREKDITVTVHASFAID